MGAQYRGQRRVFLRVHVFKTVGAYSSGKEEPLRLWISPQCFNVRVVSEFLCTTLSLDLESDL